MLSGCGWCRQWRHHPHNRRQGKGTESPGEKPPKDRPATLLVCTDPSAYLDAYSAGDTTSTHSKRVAKHRRCPRSLEVMSSTRVSEELHTNKVSKRAKLSSRFVLFTCNLAK